MESINRPELVKEHNLNLVRKALFQARQATRQQLSAVTGISTVTLGSLLQQLLQTGEALELDEIQPASGRPARVYAYNSHRQYGLSAAVIFEDGVYQLHAVLCDLYGETVWEQRRPAVQMDETATRRYFDWLFHLRGPVGSAALGLPGVGFADYLHKGQSSEYFSLAALKELEQSTGVPFQVENDVNLAALGYARGHQVGPEETLVYLYLMRGNFGGSAVYVNGGLHRGRDRYAGELLPPPYGPDWSRASPEPPEALVEKLLVTVLPYLTILAPHRLVIASDYIRQDHLDSLKRRASAALEGHCPQFVLARDFLRDYQCGLKELVLEGFQWNKNEKA